MGASSNCYDSGKNIALRKHSDFVVTSDENPTSYVQFRNCTAIVT